jgi:hypothetical protein
MIADRNDYNRFSQDPKTNLELIASTRQMYPSGANRKGYDDFSDTEKEFAKRQVLYNHFENLDRSNFAYKSSLRPQRTNVNIGANTDKNYTQNFVERFVKATEENNTGKIIDIGRELFAGNGSIKFNNVKKMSDGTIQFDYQPKVAGEVLDEVKTESLDPNDPNFQYKLASIYQQATGSDNKLEKAIYSGKMKKYNQGENIKKENIPTKSDYTNITETKEGATLGVKNGKWYNIKTGKVVE